MTIAVDQVNSQAGNLLPGDWVDLYYSRSDGGGAVLIPLLQRVEVLAAGATLLAGDEEADPAAADRNFSTITLGLSGTDAARVVLAQQSGILSVVLRSPLDTSEMPAEPRSSQELLLRPSRARSASGDTRIEMLVGGNGGVTPDRQGWQSGRRAAPGDRS